jgi:Spy/CpxP family protein refolding chaperone
MACGSVALAQEAQPSQERGADRQQRRQRQGDQAGDRGQRGQRGQRGGMFGMNLPDSLKLTEEQKTKVQEIQRSTFQEMRQQQGGGFNREDMQKMGETRRQIRDAAQAGDDAKVAQLQAELDGMAFSQTRKQTQDRIDTQIAQILTPEQRRQFEQYKRLRDSGLPPQMIDRPEALKTTALKIQTLSDVQKNGIEAAYERYDRGATHADEVAKSALADQFATEVLATLKPSQKALLTSQAMMEAGGRGGQRGPGARGPRGANGTADPSAPAAGNGAAAPQTAPGGQ